MSYSIAKGDCLPLMKSLEPASVDCVFVDLPYFGIVGDDWDNQWKDRNEYLDWVVSLAHEWKRITKDNSSIFVFCDEKMEAYIQVRLDEIFLLLNKIVWFKKNSLAKSATETFRSFAPVTERALFYAVGNETDKFEFEPLRKYLDDERKKAKLNDKEARRKMGISEKGGGLLSHFWGHAQWMLPTHEQYSKLQKAYHGFFTKPHDELVREFESLRRPFNSDSKTFDVIEWANVNVNDNTDHPTTKPLGLYRRILSVITNQGQTVLDCCMGSGTAGVAALELGRNFIGFELKDKYFSIAEARIKLAAQSPSFYTLPNNRLHLTGGGLPATQSSFTAEVIPPAKLPAKSPRR